MACVHIFGFLRLSPESCKINNTMAGLLTRSTFNAFPFA